MFQILNKIVYLTSLNLYAKKIHLFIDAKLHPLVLRFLNVYFLKRPSLFPIGKKQKDGRIVFRPKF
jgi:hypothetical protein